MRDPIDVAAAWTAFDRTCDRLQRLLIAREGAFARLLARFDDPVDRALLVEPEPEAALALAPAARAPPADESAVDFGFLRDGVAFARDPDSEPAFLACGTFPP